MQAGKQFRLEQRSQDQLKINQCLFSSRCRGPPDCFLIDFRQECRVTAQQSNQAQDTLLIFVAGISSLFGFDLKRLLANRKKIDHGFSV